LTQVKYYLLGENGAVQYSIIENGKSVGGEILDGQAKVIFPVFLETMKAALKERRTGIEKPITDEIY